MNKRLLATMLTLSLSCLTSCNAKIKSDEPIISYEQEDFTMDKINTTTKFTLDEKLLKIEEEKIEEVMPEPIVEENSITISAVGDCTLGWDDRSTYTNSLPYVLEEQNNDYSYFFAGVYDVLSNDDLTIANLEGPLTEATARADKKFTFKGSSDYINILTSSSVEAVNLANNHTYDYLEQGYFDTLNTLEDSPLEYFGNDIFSIVEVNGKKIELCGIKGWDVTSACNNIDCAMEYFESCNTDLEVFSFHWGEERVYKQNSTQETIARYAIDSGADLVLGHHPHVLQGIEEYNGKYIVYSLGNFVFGGNKNPSDKDTMIFQITFNYRNDEITDTIINIIPASLSSVSDKNDYQPIILDGLEKEKILKKVLDASTNLNYTE
ncbi:MAG: CapA family protein [Erysipelotrichales bacterium]|nr:CapA family protein [Erysipelotrichales bacterium]